VDHERGRLDRSATARALDAYQERALSLFTATETARAFDLSSETPAIRDDYGRTAFGRSGLDTVFHDQLRRPDSLYIGQPIAELPG
jgi:hypothetical protein